MLFVLRSLRSPDAPKWPPILRRPLPINRGQHRPNHQSPTRPPRGAEEEEGTAEAAGAAEVIDAPTLTLPRSRPLAGEGTGGGGYRGRNVGKAITSRIDGLSVISMTSRSMPMPSPPHGGSPYSRAVT